MANFALVFPIFMQWEGGYANDPADSGGETYKGVSRNAHPAWEGWKIVDDFKRKYGGILPKNFFIPSPALDQLVFLVFKKEYWDYFRADQIKTQELADLIVDWGWMSGKVTAAREVQELLGLHPDGHVGPLTIAALNKQDPERFFHKVQKARIEFSKAIVRKNPAKQKYLNGWINRIMEYESPETKKRWLALKLGGVLAGGVAGALYLKSKGFKL